MDAGNNGYLPQDADGLLTLAATIIARHQRIGGGSPPINQLIADLHYKTSLARAKHEEVRKYEKLMHEAESERDYLLGLKRESVKSNTKELLQSLLEKVRQNQPELLSRWEIEEYR